MLSVRGQLRSAEVHLAPTERGGWSLDSIPDFSTESSLTLSSMICGIEKTLRLKLDLDLS